MPRREFAASLQRYFETLLEPLPNPGDLSRKHENFRRKDAQCESEFRFKVQTLRAGGVEGKGINLFERAFAKLNESYVVRLEALNRALVFAEQQAAQYRGQEDRVEAEIDCRRGEILLLSY